MLGIFEIFFICLIAFIFWFLIFLSRDSWVRTVSGLYSTGFLLIAASKFISPNYLKYIFTYAGYITLSYTLLMNVLTIKHFRRMVSLKDALTGCLTRAAISDHINYEIKKGERIKKKFNLLFIDLNNFKQINDKYGHSAGDKVLAKAAAIIKENIRKYDILGRWGGDEFVVLMPEAGSAEAQTITDKLSKLTAEYENFEISLSIGCAHYPEDGYTIEKLIDTSDKRMYESRNRKVDIK
ncbi:MAG: GGDEF domain-containing protein [Thermodesulfovibrionales bacterium]|nr:GGDEF domain-containing protein [Thermodesulfovibrionales bacterium]